jgi:hypothetical protein
VEDDVLEPVLGVAGAELARVGVHCEGHGEFWVEGYALGCVVVVVVVEVVIRVVVRLS